MENLPDSESERSRQDMGSPNRGGRPLEQPEPSQPDRVQINEIDDLAMVMRGTESVEDEAGTTRRPASGLILGVVAALIIIVLALPILWGIAMVVGVVSANLATGVIVVWAIAAVVTLVVGVLLAVGVLGQT